MVFCGTIINGRGIDVHVVVSTRLDGVISTAPDRINSAQPEVRPWEVRFAHPWRSKARLPIHIAMGGYASHGRTSVRALK